MKARAPAALDAPLLLRHHARANRIIRSATFEGLGDANGQVLTAPMITLYRALLDGGVRTLVTGFMAVSAEGRAVQPGQCALHSSSHAAAWRTALTTLRSDFVDATYSAQLAHCGRQTLRRVTGHPTAESIRQRAG